MNVAAPEGAPLAADQSTKTPLPSRAPEGPWCGEPSHIFTGFLFRSKISRYVTRDDLKLLNFIKDRGQKSDLGIYSIPRLTAKRLLGFSDYKMDLILNGKNGTGGMKEKVEGFDLIKGSKTTD